MLWAKKLVKNKAIAFCREVDNCQWCLRLSCFTKQAMLLQGSKKEENCRQNQLKVLFGQRDLLAALLPSPAAGAQWVTCQEGGFHSMQWQGGGTLPADTTLGFILEFSRCEIQVAVGLWQPGTLLQDRLQAKWANVVVTTISCYFGIGSFSLSKAFSVIKGNFTFFKPGREAGEHRDCSPTVGTLR